MWTQFPYNPDSDKCKFISNAYVSDNIDNSNDKVYTMYSRYYTMYTIGVLCV